MKKTPATGKNVQTPRRSKPKKPLTEAQRAKYPRISEAMKGNTRSLVHGQGSRAVRNADLPEMSHLKEVRAQDAAGFLSDFGGASEITTAQRVAIETLLPLLNVRDYVTAHILRDGVTTQAGRTRSAVNTLLGVTDRIERLVKLLGLERKAKPVGDLESFLAARSTTPVLPATAQNEEDGDA